MAANHNSRGDSNGFGGLGQSPFFNQSLGGGLTVDNLSGPLLFTPVPLSSAPEATPQAESVADTHQPPLQQQALDNASQASYFQPNAPNTQAMQHQGQFMETFPPTQYAPPPFQQVQQMPSSDNLYQSSSYTEPQVTQAAGHSPATFNAYEQQNAPPGMQYMKMPFDGEVPSPPQSSASQEGSFNRPMNVVSPQPQNPYSRSAQSSPSMSFVYHPIQPHWFYLKDGSTWVPFSYLDSRNLEATLLSKERSVVSTNGGRYDVDLDALKREPVYWKEQKTDVRRCTWFYRGESEVKLIPYEIHLADLLEKEFKAIVATASWGKRVDLPNGDTVIFHNANVIVHYQQTTGSVDWTGEDSKLRPKVVRRGISDISEEIFAGEPDQIDHLVFVVHGIGPASDLRMRTIIDCVEDLRQQGLMQLGTHQLVKEGLSAGRVEFLPIEWYSNLHNDRHGVDDRLKAITLSSIGKFRSFTNETLTDILFFTSPMYCQAICDTVVNEMNRLLQVFKSRNPSFQGQTSVCGHSLGACILFDILANQADIEPKESLEEVVEEVIEGNADAQESFTEEEDYVEAPVVPPPVLTQSLSQTFAAAVQEDSIPEINEVLKKLNLLDLSPKFHEERIDTETLLLCSEADIKDLGIPMGPRKKLMGFVREQAQIQEKKRIMEIKKEAEAPSVASFTVSTATKALQSRKRSVMKGTQTYVFKSFSSSSVEIPYERGLAGTGQPTVQYSKLDFHPSHMFALGSPVGLFTTVRGVSSLGLNFKFPTCSSFFNIFHPYDPVAYRIEPLVNPAVNVPPVLMPHHKGRKRFHLELRENLSRVSENLKQGFIEAVRSTWATINQFARSHRNDQLLEMGEEENEAALGKPMQNQDDSLTEATEPEDTQEMPQPQVNFGLLNSGKRIDFVLQERPLEVLNEYLFALSSHTCYWTSEDTVLLMLRAIYGVE